MSAKERKQVRNHSVFAHYIILSWKKQKKQWKKSGQLAMANTGDTINIKLRSTFAMWLADATTLSGAQEKFYSNMQKISWIKGRNMRFFWLYISRMRINILPAKQMCRYLCMILFIPNKWNDYRIDTQNVDCVDSAKITMFLMLMMRVP